MKSNVKFLSGSDLCDLSLFYNFAMCSILVQIIDSIICIFQR